MRSSAFVGLCVALGACTFGHDTSGSGARVVDAPAGPVFAPAGYGYGDELDVVRVALDGRVGNIATTDNASVEHATGSADYVSVELRTRGSNGAIMNVLSVDRARIEPGLHMESTIEGLYGEWSGDAIPYVGVLGCSGQVEDEWEFDVSADSVVLDVTEDGDMLVLAYEARWYDGSSARGTVEVPRESIDSLY